jgi:hypothetical protein
MTLVVRTALAVVAVVAALFFAAAGLVGAGFDDYGTAAGCWFVAVLFAVLAGALIWPPAWLSAPPVEHEATGENPAGAAQASDASDPRLNVALGRVKVF